jgi:hypothetical protein
MILLALVPIRLENTAIESPGSKVEALFREILKCEESRQKQRVDDTPGKESSKLQSKTLYSRLAKSVYESNATSISLPMNEALTALGSRKYSSEEKKSNTIPLEYSTSKPSTAAAELF